MNPTGIYKIILIESDEDLRNRIQIQISSIEGYMINAFENEKEAFDFLESSEKDSVALIISSYKRFGMKGDQILLKARDFSPDSCRMLVSDMSDIDTVVNAINQADIHYCLALPFKGSDLLRQVDRACRNFQESKKLSNLRRVTQRQNKQLFKMASDLKSKDENEILQIQKRNATILKLKERLSRVKHSNDIEKTPSLMDVLMKRGTEFSSNGLGTQFSLMKDQIRNIFEKALSDTGVGIDDISYEQIRNHPSIEPEWKKRATEILQVVLKELIPGTDEKKEKDGSIVLITGGLMDNYLELMVSPNGLSAVIKFKKQDPRIVNLTSIKEFLASNYIGVGLKSDFEIESWLNGSSLEGESFVIAMGKEPTPPVNAQVRYFFPMEYRNAGRLRPDGSLDFTDRGRIPFVKKDTCLAEKMIAIAGKPGQTVFGEIIPVPEPEDSAFAAGTGARISEDAVKIYADTDGRPHLDALGNITVLSELEIKGDVGFETGNIEFEGNLIVKGTVQQGFSIKAVCLTVDQIQGADIVLTGDLHVSSGIIDANLIKVRGNIQAKYVNNSKIDAFGDLIIQKEIIDSTIRLGGRCINPTGTIISSQISAKKGMETGHIGTTVSKPSSLSVGVDTYVNFLVEQIEFKQNKNSSLIKELKEEMAQLEKENHDLHLKISEYAYTQDRSQLELKDVNNKMFDSKASGNIQAFHKGSQMVRKLEENIRKAEEKINKGFERQDGIAVEISQKRIGVEQYEKMNTSLEKEKMGLNELSGRNESVPEIIVTRAVMPGTRIKGPNSSVTIREITSRCKIMEIKRENDGLFFHEMAIIKESSK